MDNLSSICLVLLSDNVTLDGDGVGTATPIVYANWSPVITPWVIPKDVDTIFNVLYILFNCLVNLFLLSIIRLISCGEGHVELFTKLSIFSLPSTIILDRLVKPN